MALRMAETGSLHEDGGNHFSFVALLMEMNLTQSISWEKIDEGAARSSSWLTAANMDMLV